MKKLLELIIFGYINKKNKGLIWHPFCLTLWVAIIITTFIDTRNHIKKNEFKNRLIYAYKNDFVWWIA